MEIGSMPNLKFLTTLSTPPFATPPLSLTLTVTTTSCGVTIPVASVNCICVPTTLMLLNVAGLSVLTVVVVDCAVSGPAVIPAKFTT
jgi:hypothetical protein